MSDSQRRAEAIAVLSEAFRQKVTEVTLAAYEMGLSDVPPDSLQRAVVSAIRTSKFMPTVAELRALAGESELTAEDRAVVAWGAVQKATRIGSYKSVDFDDPVVNAAIRMLGGWPSLLERSPAEFDKWTRKEFIQTYVSLYSAGVRGDACAALPGLAETQPTAVKSLEGQYVNYEPKAPTRIETGLMKPAPRIGQ